MRAISRIQGLRLLLLVPFLAVSALAQSVSLSQFQQINGFPSGCTKAYNTPIPGCTPNDFTGSNVCSSACISGLMALTTLINSACSGISTSPNTLIGLFFQGKGVQALCPETTGQQPTTIVIGTSSAPPPPTQSTASPPTSSSSVQQSSTSVQSSSSTQISTSASSAPATANPSQASSSGSPSPLPSFTFAPSATSAVTAQPQSTSSTNSFGGSIDPFGASAAPLMGSNSMLMISVAGAGILLGWML